MVLQRVGHDWAHTQLHYLTTNQSEESPRADHALLEPLLWNSSLPAPGLGYSFEDIILLWPLLPGKAVKLLFSTSSPQNSVSKFNLVRGERVQRPNFGYVATSQKELLSIWSVTIPKRCCKSETQQILMIEYVKNVNNLNSNFIVITACTLNNSDILG